MAGLSGARFGILGLACVCAPVSAAAVYRFDIQPQSLSAALASFARQAGLQLVYYSELAERLTSPRLAGDYSTDEALQILLAGSHLTFAILDGNTVVIEPRPIEEPGAETATVEASPAEVGQGDGRTSRMVLAVVPEEVLVMARRREENLQAVPISVSAINASQIDSRSIDNTESLNRRVANVAVASTGFFGRQSGLFRMRGIPGVAIYVDGVVQGGGAGALQNVVEVERIEVLRGPQGTLFGKNAVGGAIQYISQAPRSEFGGRLRATFGAYDRIDVTANIDIPFSPTVLTKLTAAQLSRNGYLPSTTTGERLGSQEDKVARWDVAWRPSDAFEGRFKLEYSRQRTNGNPSTVWALNPVCAGDPVPANFIGEIPNNPCVYEAVGLPIREEWVYGAREERRTASDYRGPDLGTETKGAKAEVTWALSPVWTGRAIGGYRRVESTGYADFDGTPYKIFDGQNYNERAERSVELQALHASGPLRGTTGLYFYSDRTWGRRMNWLANELDADVNPALFAAARAYFPAFGDAGVAGASVVDALSNANSRGWAAFAEWSYFLTPRFTLTAGARYNRDTISTAAYRPATAVGQVCCVPEFSLVASGPPLENRSGSATFSQVSPRLSVQYQSSPDVMLYFTYSEGFGAGGFTGGNIPDVENGGFRSFGPELLNNYELGMRSDFLQGKLRFNLSAFFGRYDDIQVAEELIPRFPTTSNAGEAEIRGVEVEGTWTPVPRLSLNYGLGWLDTAYTDLGQVTNIRLDTPFAYAPRYSYTIGAQYQWPVRGGGRLSVRGDWGWQDEVIATLDINTGSVIPSYGLASARVAYQPADARWDVALAGTNLFNEYYRINGFFIPADQMDNGTVGRPREWSLSFSFSF